VEEDRKTIKHDARAAPPFGGISKHAVAARLNRNNSAARAAALIVD
jgi:hypothetical protein